MEKQRNKWYILNLESECEPIQYLADWDMMIAFFDYLRLKDKEDRRVKAFDSYASGNLHATIDICGTIEVMIYRYPAEHCESKDFEAGTIFDEAKTIIHDGGNYTIATSEIKQSVVQTFAKIEIKDAIVNGKPIHHCLAQPDLFSFEDGILKSRLYIPVRSNKLEDMLLDIVHVG